MDGALYCQCSSRFIEVRPHEIAELTQPQASSQLCVEEVVPDSVGFHFLLKLFQLVIIQDLLGLGICFWNRDTFSGISGNDVGFFSRFLLSGIQNIGDLLALRRERKAGWKWMTDTTGRHTFILKKGALQ